MTSIQETISILKGLIVACHGIEQGYNESAEAIKDAKVKAVWREIALQEHKMASELEQAVVRLGGDPRHGGLAGASQLLWPDQGTGQEPESRLPDGPREEAQRAIYRSALQADLPLNVHMLVQRQHVEISAVRERVRQLGQTQLQQAGGKTKAKLSRAVPRAITWFDF
jgi:uncharacterized protein (TIGR02284 family)